MASRQPESENTTPGATGWLAAIISLVLIISLAILVAAAGLVLHFRLKSQRIQSAISAGDVEQVRLDLASIYNPPRPLRWFYAFQGGRLQYPRLLRLLDVAQLVFTGQFTGALPALQGALQDGTVALMPGGNGRTCTDSLFTNIQLGIELIEQLREKRGALSRTTARRKGFILQQRTLAQDLAALFGITATGTTDLNSELSFYQSGIFSGLPVIDGLRDGISNLHDVREAVKKIGGQIDNSGPNPHETFMQRLNDLKSSSSVLNSELSQVEVIRHSLEKVEIPEMVQQLEGLKNTIGRHIGSIIDIVLRMDREPQVCRFTAGCLAFFPVTQYDPGHICAEQ